MLFRPLKPVKIGGFTLPFTPGIIPRRKPALARAIGNMVGKSLIGKDEIKEIFVSESMKKAVISAVTNSAESVIKEKSLKDMGEGILGEDAYHSEKEKAVNYISERITEGVSSIDIAGIIITEGTAAVKNMGGMISMFVNENMIASFAGPIGNKVENYIATNGKELIISKVEDELSNIEIKHLDELIHIENTDVIADVLEDIYDTMIDKGMSDVVSAFDICGIVENKINQMDVKELEELIMSVMKHELGVIVNLGALIGFVLGLVNLCFR